MSLNMKKMKSGGAKRVRDVQDGTYMSRICRIIDLGPQVQTDWKTQEPKLDDDGNPIIKPELQITFELPDQLRNFAKEGEPEDLKPCFLSKKYVASTHEKSALMGLLRGLNKQNISSLSELIGLPCMVQVGSTATGNAKITNVLSPLSGMVVKDMINEGYFFDWDNPDPEIWGKMYDWLKGIIRESPAFNTSAVKALDSMTESKSDV